jgi:hypothetical protein
MSDDAEVADILHERFPQFSRAAKVMKSRDCRG